MEDDFFEIGGDSLQATEHAARGRGGPQQLLPSEWARSLTIRRLCDEARAIGGRTRRADDARVKSGQGTPLFLCHGDSVGRGLYGFRLSEMLKGGRTGPSAYSLLDGPAASNSIEEMVSLYLARHRAVAPSRAHTGWPGIAMAALPRSTSSGASRRRDAPVEKVVLIDTFSSMHVAPCEGSCPSCAWPPSRRTVPGAPGPQAPAQRHAVSVWVLASHILARDPAILRRVTKTARSGAMRASAFCRRTIYYRAMSKYLPRRISAAVICLLSEEYAGRKEMTPRRGPAWRRRCSAVACPGSTIPASARTSTPCA